jgi:hypothetical protein
LCKALARRLGKFFNQSRHFAARDEAFREGREFIHRPWNYEPAAAIQNSERFSYDILMRLLAAGKLFSLAVLGIFRRDAKSPRTYGYYANAKPRHLGFQGQRKCCQECFRG